MRRIVPWIALAGHLALALAVFLVLFAAPASDDYAGWSLASAGLALPGWFMLLRRRDPLGPVRALLVAVPAGVGLGCVVVSFFLLARAVELTRLDALVLLTPAAWLALTVIVWRRIRGLATRDAVGRVAVVVGAPALVGLTLNGLAWRDLLATPGRGAELSFEQGLALAVLLLDLLPLVWALGLGLAWVATLPATQDDAAAKS